ncbi:MAG: cytochrome c biogenesis protein CcsA [Chloroflexi bacterium]|nr:cytochrome c biogenesis protein CcsA [Chloroflexota bacterium]
MPPDVLVVSFWGGQAGSLLLWAWVMSLAALFVVWAYRNQYDDLMPTVGAVLMVILTFFVLMLTFVASPFERLPAPMPDGRGLNPLLWDDGMRIHPPLLLTGYMSFAIPFAFAMAALITGHLDNRWLRAVRPWAMLSWGIQGLGLLAGAWWAYHVLGWGGYWGWDPVENAALMPWLASTAFLHSIMVQERRGMLKVWNLALVITSFVLAIFGTFVVRSGVLSSVHSFAQSPLGPYFFGFLGTLLILSLGLFFARMPALKSEGEFDGVASREVSFLFNNLALLAMTAAIFWGTVFPLLSEMARGAKITVGPPFYNQVNGPLLLLLLVLMGIGPLLAWRRTSNASLWRNFRMPLTLGGLTLMGLLAGGMYPQWLAAFSFACCAFVFGTIVLEYARGMRARQRTGENAFMALYLLVARNRRRYGGYLSHLAVLLAAVAIIGSTFFQHETIMTLKPGETGKLADYDLTFQSITARKETGLDITAAPMIIRRNGSVVQAIEPQRRVHRGWEQQPISGIAIATSLPWFDDIYVLLTGWEADGSAHFRVFVTPLVSLLWVGAGLFLISVVVVAWPEGRPRRVPAPRLTRAPQPSEAGVS